MRQNFDREGKINVINWLRALGIPNQTIQIKNVAKKAPPVKILTDAQLKTAQRLLTKVADDMNRKALSIDRHRPSNGNKTLKPA